MIKKFLLATFLLLSSFGLANAGLPFTYASADVICEDANSARRIFQLYQKERPVLSNTKGLACFNIPSFGNPLIKKMRIHLTRVSAVENDWEGDPIAVFKIINDPFRNGLSSWFIIYNPADLIGRRVHI